MSKVKNWSNDLWVLQTHCL